MVRRWRHNTPGCVRSPNHYVRERACVSETIRGKPENSEVGNRLFLLRVPSKLRGIPGELGAEGSPNLASPVFDQRWWCLLHLPHTYFALQ